MFQPIDLGECPSEQQVFDAAAKYLLEQEKRCTDESGRKCLYRSKDGENACAVGLFLPNDFPHLHDNAGVSTMMLSSASRHFPPWFLDHLSLLQDLQDVHDESAFLGELVGYTMREWRNQELHSLASLYKLDTSVLDEVS